MPKHVAEETQQLSVRLDKQQLMKIDQIRKRMEEAIGIVPQRSDVVRKVIGYGIDEFCSRNHIVLEDVVKPVSEKKRTKKP